MKKILFIVTLLTWSLTACVPAFTPTTEAHESDRPWNIPPSFESQTYTNESAGFALEYPVGWTVKETVVGERGSQVMLLSSPDIAELAALPEGATRITVTANPWDPKNDLAAFVANQKTAWDASGFTVLEEEAIQLDLGLDAVRFVARTPDGHPSTWLFAAVGEQYVTISGEGDLTLVQEIMQYLRPLGTP